MLHQRREEKRQSHEKHGNKKHVRLRTSSRDQQPGKENWNKCKNEEVVMDNGWGKDDSWTREDCIDIRSKTYKGQTADSLDLLPTPRNRALQRSTQGQLIRIKTIYMFFFFFFLINPIFPPLFFFPFIISFHIFPHFSCSRIFVPSTSSITTL